MTPLNWREPKTTFGGILPSSMSKYTSSDVEFKVKVVLEVLKEQKTLAQVHHWA